MSFTTRWSLSFYVIDTHSSQILMSPPLEQYSSTSRFSHPVNETGGFPWCQRPNAIPVRGIQGWKHYWFSHCKRKEITHLSLGWWEPPWYIVLLLPVLGNFSATQDIFFLIKTEDTIISLTTFKSCNVNKIICILHVRHWFIEENGSLQGVCLLIH